MSDLIVDISEYRKSVPEEVPWVVEPLVYYGGVTLLAGHPKGGKSTLLSTLMRSRERERAFLGIWPCAGGPTLLVTEESGVAVTHKAHGLKTLEVLDRRSAVLSRTPWEPRSPDAPSVLGEVYAWAKARPESLVVIDTLAAWAEVQNENDAAEMTGRVGDVIALATSTGCAVVVIHHTRKGGGVAGEAIRGSSAIFASVDIAAEMADFDPSRPDDTRRTLTLQGRVISPQRYLLDFDGSDYEAVDWADALVARDEEMLEAFDSGPRTKSDLEEAWGVTDKTVRERLKKLKKEGHIEELPRRGNEAARYQRLEEAGRGGITEVLPASPASPRVSRVSRGETRGVVTGNRIGTTTLLPRTDHERETDTGEGR